MGNYKYPIEAIQASTNNQQNVSRRFSEIDSFHSLLKLIYPGCIIPGIPAKNIGSSEEAMVNRHMRLKIFFEKVRQHPVLSKSKILELFLT
jgi:hypothetical protein